MDLSPSHLWFIAGFLLLCAEMLTGGFFLLFIALGCLTAGLVAYVIPSLALQLLSAAFVNIVSALTLRKPLQSRLLRHQRVAGDIGQELVAPCTLEPHTEARIEYQGTTWPVINVSQELILQGELVTIVGIDGIVLHVRKK